MLGKNIETKIIEVRGIVTSRTKKENKIKLSVNDDGYFYLKSKIAYYYDSRMLLKTEGKNIILNFGNNYSLKRYKRVLEQERYNINFLETDLINSIEKQVI